MSTIVWCGDRVGRVYEAVASIEAQTLTRGELILISDTSTPDRAHQWLDAFATSRGATLLRVDSDRPGAVRNAGIGAATGRYVVCLDAGDRLDPSYHATCASVMDAQTEVDLVTTSTLFLGPGPARHTRTPAGCTLDVLIGDTAAIHSASMFKRQAAMDLGGFDETLPCLEDYDFFLRLLARSGRGALVERPLLLRTRDADLPFQRRWGTTEHAETFHQLVERHAELFEEAFVTALYQREQALNDTGRMYKRLVDRHEDARREIRELKTRVDQLKEQVAFPQSGSVDFGDLRRTSPIARDWGYERGTPIDRYYIEQFLERQAGDIRGQVLEVQESDYTTRFGKARVTQSDVVDVDASNPRATIVADLRAATNIPANTYDCVIVTQTLHVVDSLPAVITECARVLKPGGVLLATLPCASRVCLEYGDRGDFWRVTEAGARELFERTFASGDVEVCGKGNVLVNTAFLYGLGCHELDRSEFEVDDPYHPLLITVRAHNTAPPSAGGGGLSTGSRRSGVTEAAILLYHRIGREESDVHGLSVPPAEFRDQLRHLRDRYHVVPLADVVRGVREGDLPDRAVALTFDDGYVDNYTTASPALLDFDLPATFCIPTEALDSPAPYRFWWDRLEEAVLMPSPGSEMLTIDLPDGPREFPMAHADQRLAAHREIYTAVSGHPADVRNAVVAAVEAWGGRGTAIRPTLRRMNATELRSLASRPGHTIAAHSVCHLMLSHQSAETQRREAADSKSALETLLDQEVACFAYPFGACDASSAAAAEAAGFDSAVACENRLVTRHADVWRLPRLEVPPSPDPGFAAWLDGQFS